MTLRKCLYQFWTFDDDSSMFAEIHQCGPMSNVEVVVPDVKEAEMALAMMNKQATAYFVFYLKDLLVDQEVIEALCNGFEPTLVHEIGQCKWDLDAKTITTPQDLAEGEGDEAKKEAWYIDAVSAQLSGAKKKKGKRNSYAAPKALFDLDDKPSIKTINKRNDGNYECFEADETLQLRVGKKHQKEANTVEDEDSDSDIVEMSGNKKTGLRRLTPRLISRAPI